MRDKSYGVGPLADAVTRAQLTTCHELDVNDHDHDRVPPNPSSPNPSFYRSLSRYLFLHPKVIVTIHRCCPA